MNLCFKVAGFIVLAILMGCAPPPKAYQPVPDRSSLLGQSSNALSSALLSSDSDWNCPPSANLALKSGVAVGGGFDYSGNGDYTVCVSRSNSSSFKLSGYTSAPNICIYPMYSNNTGSVQLADSPKCFALTGSPVTATFASGAMINYMVIVDSNYAQAMNACLSGPSACPSRSEGFVQ